MKLILGLAILAITVKGVVALESAEVKSFVGTIVDSTCAEKDTFVPGRDEIDKECVLACFRLGARLVLADEVAKSVYHLDDQKAVMEFAGERVKIIGRLDRKSMTIKLRRIEPMQP